MPWGLLTAVLLLGGSAAANAEVVQYSGGGGPTVAGTWDGIYLYPEVDASGTPVGKPPVRFHAEFTQYGLDIGGRITEPATFGAAGTPTLYANVMDGKMGEDGSIRFIKRYDGTGGVEHDVLYQGFISPDGQQINGAWSIGEWKGTFRLVAASPVPFAPAKPAAQAQEPPHPKSLKWTDRLWAAGTLALAFLLFGGVYYATRMQPEATEAVAPSAPAAKPAESRQGSVQEARSLLRKGDYDSAFGVLQSIDPLPEADRPLHDALRGVAVNRRSAGAFSAARAYADRLEVASKLSELGLHAEAVGVLTESVILAASKDEHGSEVASIYAKAGETDDFVMNVALRRTPEFYSAYARAFDRAGQSRAALALLSKKERLNDDDYTLFFSLHKRLGSLGALDPMSLPEEIRPRLTRALLEDKGPS
ncbi:MAG: hypothetical protein WC728_17765 [Elusimicrobiota bacterium]